MSEQARVAVVTGGSAGIGRVTVREFAAAGYDVAVLARGQAGVDGVVNDIEQAGRRGLGLLTDVADSDSVEAAADRVEAELGPISVWVNVALAGSLAWFWETSAAEYQRMTDVTHHGQVNGTRAALRVMRARDRGAIVNVASAMAYRSIPLQSAYCGAKHAIKGFTESVLTELRASGSRVTIGLVTLLGVKSTQFGWNLNKMSGHPRPVPPIVQPEVCARSIRFCAEHPRRNMWVGLATPYTVLGNRVAPLVMDWYLAKTAVKSQRTDRDLPRWGSNVFEPRDEHVDRGARGAFSDSAWGRDPISFLARHRRAAIGLAGLATAWVTRSVGSRVRA